MQRSDRLRAVFRPLDPDLLVWPERDWIGRQAVWEALWPVEGDWMCQIEPEPPEAHPGVFALLSELQVIEQLGPRGGPITAVR